MDMLIPCVFAEAAPANSVLKSLFLSLSPYQQDRIQSSVPSGVVDYTVLCKKFMSFCSFEMLSVVPVELKTNLISIFFVIEFQNVRRTKATLEVSMENNRGGAEKRTDRIIRRRFVF